MSIFTTTPFREWAILELMDHQRLAGLVTEVEVLGAKMCRIDIPIEPEPATEPKWSATQIYGAGAIHCVTLTTEEEVRKTLRPTEALPPLSRLDAPQPPKTPVHRCASCTAWVEGDAKQCSWCISLGTAPRRGPFPFAAIKYHDQCTVRDCYEPRVRDHRYCDAHRDTPVLCDMPGCSNVAAVNDNRCIEHGLV